MNQRHSIAPSRIIDFLLEENKRRDGFGGSWRFYQFLRLFPEARGAEQEHAVSLHGWQGPDRFCQRTVTVCAEYRPRHRHRQLLEVASAHKKATDLVDGFCMQPWLQCVTVMLTT
ncbi:hypothetical protein [Collimonas silvisoli]